MDTEMETGTARHGDKATRINLSSFAAPQMRTFHMTWFAFFLCFFGWFGITPMLKIVREDLGITTDQIVTTNMAAVASTVLMRLLVGWACDVIGPRLTYGALLIVGSIPVMAVGLANDYETFLLMRIAIGAIGASFVITQYHTSQMFAPNCVGTANAITAGWGNSGAGASHFIMPLLFAAAVSLVGSETLGWRVAMALPGVALFLTGFAYLLLTQDTPAGNFKDLRRAGLMPSKKRARGTFWPACADTRVWALFLIYGACFGVELVIDSKIALYLADYFALGLTAAGLVGGLFGIMGIFARPLGGWMSDKAARRFGMQGRAMWLFVTLLAEGLALMVFSQVSHLVGAVVMLAIVGIVVRAGCGATFGIVPFINKTASGAVAGIVGAGGNAVAVALMFLFKEQLTGFAWPTAFLITGVIVTAISFATFALRFPATAESPILTDSRPRVQEATATG